MLYIYYSKKNYNVNSFYKKVNNIYGDYMQDKEIFSLSLDIGKEIIRAGGEISRAKDTIIRINKAYGNNCEVCEQVHFAGSELSSLVKSNAIEKSHTRG